MKEVLSLVTFAIGAFCFVVFVTVFKPDAVSAVPGTSKPEHCNTEVSPKHGCRQYVLAAVSGSIFRSEVRPDFNWNRKPTALIDHSVISRVQHGNDRSTQFGARYI
jgi:hypothetical protein